MRISKSAVGFLLSMILLSIFLANVFNLLSTDALVPKDDAKENYLQINNENEHLIWFLQISDIHISIFKDPQRISQFKEFCHYTIDTIKPSVVLASGDLTDAKTRDAIGSQQFETEWKYYRDILRDTNIPEKTKWLDIRGNHDNFNVASSDSRQNFFTNYSIQGAVHPRSYMYQIKKGNELYSFMAVDACLEPGPKRPFNFVGMLDDLEVEEINNMIDKSKKTNSNYTIWFGHFPTSCILSTGKENLRELIRKTENGLVYLCGHLHTLGGLVPKMYALQKAGFLELELGDWKDNRVYRLLAIDHGLFSFTDVKYNNWPVVLITNPKHALFYNPAKENLENIKRSTHIRILAFSIDPIKSVKVRINDGNWVECDNVDGALYTTPWDTKLYENDLHTIVVQVVDVRGREIVESQPFSLDGTKLSFKFLPKIALMTNASVMFQTMFAVMLIVCIIPLCILRYINELVIVGKVARPRLHGCGKVWLRKLWILSTVDRIFWPIVLYPIYLTVGPWCIGHLIENHIGVVFAWGIFVNGAFLPGSFTYAYGFIQLLSFQIPLTLIMAHALDKRFRELLMKPGKKTTVIGVVLMHLPFFIVFTLQTIMAYLFWLAYGTLAFILGPLRTWSILLAVVLYYEALHLPEKCTRKAAEIWTVKSEPAISSTDIDSTTAK